MLDAQDGTEDGAERVIAITTTWYVRADEIPEAMASLDAAFYDSEAALWRSGPAQPHVAPANDVTEEIRAFLYPPADDDWQAVLSNPPLSDPRTPETAAQVVVNGETIQIGKH